RDREPNSVTLQMQRLWILHQDPPDHTRLRRLVNKAFTPRVVHALEPRVRAITESLLDAIPEQQPFDVVRALALPLPVAVIVELSGHVVEAGEMVLCSIAAANRDPAMHVDPDDLHLDRVEPRPITFGAGIHRCLGAALASLEGRVALSALLHRYPSIERAGPP